jgi:hypothetical protein
MKSNNRGRSLNVFIFYLIYGGVNKLQKSYQFGYSKVVKKYDFSKTSLKCICLQLVLLALIEVESIFC